MLRWDLPTSGANDRYDIMIQSQKKRNIPSEKIVHNKMHEGPSLHANRDVHPAFARQQKMLSCILYGFGITAVELIVAARCFRNSCSRQQCVVFVD